MGHSLLYGNGVLDSQLWWSVQDLDMSVFVLKGPDSTLKGVQESPRKAIHTRERTNWDKEHDFEVVPEKEVHLVSVG